ncbi:MAG: hypothetical protein ACLPYS_06685 [Vulcanimicrobiaceae bacterium]|jgi:hypothetical protein
MKLLTTVDRDSLKGAKCVAESNEFAVYALGDETYALVHRHEGTDWEAITISGDGVFRVGELLTSVMRDLYRDMAMSVSEARRRSA